MTQGLNQIVNFKITVINRSSIKHCPIVYLFIVYLVDFTNCDLPYMILLLPIVLTSTLIILLFYSFWTFIWVGTKLFKILSSFVSLWWKRKINVMKSSCLSCFSRCRMMPIFWDFCELGISIWTRYGVRCNYFCIMW